MAFTQKFNLITNITAAGVRKYKSDLDGAKRSLSGFKSKTGEAQAEVSRFGKAMTIASGILTARLIRAVAQWGVQAIQMGAQVGTLRGAFEKLTEHVDDNVVSLESLRSATRNMIPDIELLKSANIALSLGLPIEGLNDFYESALIVGNAVGITATQAVSDLSRALGRQSPLILDNLGISLKLGEAYDIYAARLGKVASALTDNERKTAFATVAIERLNEKAALLSGTMSESQISIQQGTTAIKNFQTAIGEVGASIAPTFLDPWTSALNVLMGRQKTWWMETDSTLDDVSAKYEGVTEGVLEQFDDFQAGLDTLGGLFDDTFGGMGDAAQDWSEALVGYIDDPVERMAAAEQEFDDFWEMQREGFEESISDLISYYDKYKDVTFGEFDEIFQRIDQHFTDLEDTARNSYEDQLDDIDRFYDDLVDTTTSSYTTQIRDAEKFYRELFSQTTDSYDDQIQAAIDFWMDQITEAETALSKVLSSYDRHYDDLVDIAKTAYDKQISDTESFYSALLAQTIDSYDEQTQNIIGFWMNQITETETALDGVLNSYNRHFASIISETEASYAEQTNATNDFYDNMLAEQSAFLFAIREGRGRELDDLELAYLLQKQSLEEGLVDQTLTQEDFEDQLSALEKEYRDERQDVRDNYRIQELQAEENFRIEEERINAERNDALTSIEQAMSDELQTINEENALTLINISTTLGDILRDLEQAKADEIIVIEQNLKDEIERLEQEKSTELQSINTERVATLLEIETTLGSELESLEQGKANAILAIEMTFKSEIERLEQEKSDKLQEINDKKNAAIIAANEAFLLVLRGLAAEEKADFVSLYDELLVIAETFGQDMGFELDDLANEFGFSMDDMETDVGNLKTTVEEATGEMTTAFGIMTDSVGTNLSGMKVDLDSLSTHIAGTIIDINNMLKTAKKFNTLKGSLTLPDLPQRKEPAPEPSLPPPPIISPPPPTTPPSRPPYVFIDPTVDPFPDLSAQHGFEGLVTRPTTFLVGEAGPEYVSVTPRGRGGGRVINIRGPIIQIMGDASERTARLASDLVLKQIRKYV